jgi:threonine/homoserine/homoserine lactone efflux protein
MLAELDVPSALAAFGVGAALGAFPGPVQVLLVSESSRGGLRRGLRVMLGANGTFAVFLLLLAAGLTAIEPSTTFLRVIRVAGGAFLVYLGIDGIRGALRPPGDEEKAPGRRLHPTTRGVLAVVLNPGGYLFLATTASAILADAAEAGGRPQALLTALAMLAGVSVVDAATVLLGTGSRRAFGDRVLRWLALALAVVLVGLGVVYVVAGVSG